MNCILLRRKYPDKSAKITVTLSGSGNVNQCYTTYNNTKYYTSGNTFEVQAGDTITFSVYGTDNSSAGWVTINGTQVLRVTAKAVQSYAWTVPNGINLISVSNVYAGGGKAYGRITVTTS